MEMVFIELAVQGGQANIQAAGSGFAIAVVLL
jgi:hypothetical protein